MRVLKVFMWGLVLAVETTGAVGSVEQLDPEAVFAVAHPEGMWQKIFDVLNEKSQYAQTTLEMKAAVKIKLFQKERELSKVGMELYRLLPEEIVSGRGEHPREVFLKTHQAWHEYAELQSEFLADTSSGGTAYSLYYMRTLMAEVDWRISLYKELLAGENVTKYSLYFYSCDLPKEP